MQTNRLMSIKNHPQIDVQTERASQILYTVVRKAAQTTSNVWDKILRMTEFACSIQNSIGYGLSYVAQGYNPNCPVHISADIIDLNHYSPRAEDFVRRLELIG